MKEIVDFQAHTVTHPILPACSDEKAEHEIAGGIARRGPGEGPRPARRDHLT